MLPKQNFLFLTLQKQMVGTPGSQAHEQTASLHLEPVFGPSSLGPKGSQALPPEGDFLALLTPSALLVFKVFYIISSNFTGVMILLCVNSIGLRGT